MKTLHQTSMIFLIVDIYTKLPIMNATILFENNQYPYIRKDDGHYIFKNLFPAEYKIKIMNEGYLDINLTVNLRENEIQTIILNASYTTKNPQIAGVTKLEFTVTHKNQVISDQEVMLTLNNNINFLELKNQIEPENYEIFLNSGFNTALLMQRYIYKTSKNSYKLFLIDYDNEKSCYILDDVFSEIIETGGKFKVFWLLKTDYKGRVILPIIPEFMLDDNLELELKYDNKKSKIKVNVANERNTGKVFKLDVKLRKIPQKT